MSEKILIVSTQHNGDRPIPLAVLEGWRCRHCAGTRSLYDLIKGDGLCERCRRDDE